MATKKDTGKAVSSTKAAKTAKPSASKPKIVDAAIKAKLSTKAAKTTKPIPTVKAASKQKSAADSKPKSASVKSKQLVDVDGTDSLSKRNKAETKRSVSEGKVAIKKTTANKKQFSVDKKNAQPKQSVTKKASAIKKTDLKPTKRISAAKTDESLAPSLKKKEALKSQLLQPLKAAAEKLASKLISKKKKSPSGTQEAASSASRIKPMKNLVNVKALPNAQTKKSGTALNDEQRGKPSSKEISDASASFLLNTSRKTQTKKTEIKKEKLVESADDKIFALQPRATGKLIQSKPLVTERATSSQGSNPVNTETTNDTVLLNYPNKAVKPTRAEKIIAPKNHSVGSDAPADFRPYQAESGEEYMSPEQIEHFRSLLNKWKQELMEEVDRTVHHMQDESANLPDPVDRATQEEEFTLELRARDRERKLIKKIDQALESLDSNDYGYCESCGVEIGVRRLEARPTATLCIDCKTLDEIKERQLRGS